MEIREFKAKIEKAVKEHKINQIEADDYAEYCFYGLRFEDKEREVGETCGNSKHNFERADEREFPVYGSDEYEEMMTLDGTSAWYIDESGQINDRCFKGEWQKSDDDKLLVTAEHCYIIGGDLEGSHDDPDIGEILIQDAVVVEKLF